MEYTEPELKALMYQLNTRLKENPLDMTARVSYLFYECKLLELQERREDGQA